MKPQPFTLELSNCQLRHDGGAADKNEIRAVNVRWIDGFTVDAVANENAGYLANTLPDGARISIWRCQPMIIIRWIRVIKLSPPTRSKIGCRLLKNRLMAAYLLIISATSRRPRKKRQPVH
jgi:hypothetical protein